MPPFAHLLQWLTSSPFLLTLPLLLICYFLYYQNNKAVVSRNGNKLPLPPSPPGLPLIGNLHQLGTFPHVSLQSLSHKYGPVMLLHIGRLPTLIISSAKAAQEVMKAQDTNFASRPPSRITDRIFYNSREVVFAPYGEYWRQARRVTVLHMLNPKRVQAFSPVRAEEVALLMERIRGSMSTAGSVNLSELLISLTNDIVCRAAFGLKFSEEAHGNRTHKLFRELGYLLEIIYMGELNPWLGWIDWVRGLDKRVDKCSKELDNFLNKVVKDHIARAEKYGSDDRAENTEDFLDVLLSIDAKDKETTVNFSISDIKAIILDMNIAGTDTSYSTMEWTMVELIKHPEEMRRVQEEVRRVLSECDTTEGIAEEYLDKMTYLKAVIKESLRLHTPVPLLLPKHSIRATKLLGYNVPANTRVLINAWAIARDPNYWERPEEFWPQRFVDSPIDYKGQDFQFIPFGSGRRGCPGINFAVKVVELTLANLLFHFNWELPDGRKGETLDTNSMFSGLAPHIKPKLTLVAKPFNN
ncbi:cytochrome P450 736A117-like [Typha angustifolia]|uniref:cytochrome P450 736A117-like n=1 Tax=Typha angustifolia TaxID=59011 RepID=UPI003C3082C9